MRSSANIAVLMSTTALVAAQSAPAIVASNCTVFNWDGQAAYLRNVTTPERVTAAEQCPYYSNSSHACPIEAHGDLEALFISNLSSSLLRDVYLHEGSSSATSWYFDLVNNTVPSAVKRFFDVPYQFFVLGNVDTVQQQPSNTTGYLEFLRMVQCFAGTLSNCTANTVPDNTAVEFCAPVYHTTRQANAMPILDGYYSFREISFQNLSDYPDPFEGLSRSGAPPLSLRWSMGLLGIASGLTTLILIV